MTIDPKDAPADQPFKVAVGGRGYTAQRVDPKDDSEQWRLLVPVPSNVSPWKDDEQVRIIAPLVPARNVTRDDLPSVTQAQEASVRAGGIIPSVNAVSEILDAVVAHLNANGGIPNSFNLSAEKLNVSGDVQRKSCCEEAQLTANELARRNEELADAEREIAMQAKNLKWWRHQYERSHDERRKVEAERDEAQESVSRANEFAATCQRERDEWESNADELQAKLDAAESDRDAVNDSANFWADRAAENRPTLGREAVREVVGKHCGALGGYYMNLLVNDLMALTEQAATGDEDQRVEEQAKALGAAVSRYHGDWDNFSESARERYRDAIRAGWTPPGSEATA